MNKEKIAFDLIACDLDGTLLNSKTKVSTKNIKALQNLNNLGCEYVLITGRHWKNAIGFYNEINIPATHIIGSNGATIYDLKAKKLILQRPALNADFQEVIEFIDPANSKFLLVGENLFIESRKKDPAWQTENITKTNLQVKLYDPKLLATDEIFYKIIITFEDNTSMASKTAISNLKNQFVKKFEFAEMINSNGKIYMELNSLNTSKGNALRELCTLKHLDLKKVIAVGDNDNDWSMLEIVGLSFAPLNASNSAKKASKVILPQTNDEDIVDAILHDYLKIKR